LSTRTRQSIALAGRKNGNFWKKKSEAKDANVQTPQHVEVEEQVNRYMEVDSDGDPIISMTTLSPDEDTEQSMNPKPPARSIAQLATPRRERNTPLNSQNEKMLIKSLALTVNMSTRLGKEKTWSFHYSTWTSRKN
jgi:hypothetical protein